MPENGGILIEWLVRISHLRIEIRGLLFNAPSRSVARFYLGDRCGSTDRSSDGTLFAFLSRRLDGLCAFAM